VRAFFAMNSHPFLEQKEMLKRLPKVTRSVSEGAIYDSLAKSFANASGYKSDEVISNMVFHEKEC